MKSAENMMLFIKDVTFSKPIKVKHLLIILMGCVFSFANLKIILFLQPNMSKLKKYVICVIYLIWAQKDLYANVRIQLIIQ